MRKNVSKITKIVSVMILSLVLSMTACGKSATTNEATNKPDMADSREFSQERIDRFFKLWDKMDNKTDEVLEEFVDSNFEITYEFLEKIHDAEEDYLDLKAYSKTLTVKEYEASNGNRGSVRFNLEAGWVREPIWETSYEVPKYHSGWDYSQGKITFEKDYYIDVIHVQNISTKSNAHDYEEERVYAIKNPKEDAYVVMSGETGYMIIRIIAKKG